MGITNSERGDAVSRCGKGMSTQQKESGKMGSGIQKRWRESFGTQSDYTKDKPE